jgi:arabinan endo-1,5-alpha-L-arabinosidase
MIGVRNLERWPQSFGACIALLCMAFSSLAQVPLSGDIRAHDPSTMIKEGDRYYVFHTGLGILEKYSTDLHLWHSAGRVFPDGPPAWTTNAVPTFGGRFWAPDIAFVNGQYRLYYSVSTFGKQLSAIGLATSPSLAAAHWTDQGPVIQSSTNTLYNCIDPAILVDTNHGLWMVFGSYFDGIFLTQLDPATGKRASTNSPLVCVAHNGSSAFHNTSEASYLYQANGYYYLFLNFGKCCSGVDSTYNIRVGRSTNVTGPYVDRDGTSLLKGGGSLLLQTSGRYIGPGHAGILHENGTNWFTYHYYDGDDRGTPKLGLTQLHWTADQWPALAEETHK